MTDYIEAHGDPSSPYHREAVSLAEKMSDPAHMTIRDGVARWVSNNQVPPKDCIALAAHLGIHHGAHGISVSLCTEVRDRELGEFLADYRRKDRPMSDAEKTEARAAFGAGATVVNVITGRKTKL